MTVRAGDPRTRETRAEELAAALAALRGRLDRACTLAGRDPADIRLVAVSKTWPAQDVVTLAGLGVLDLGENRDQEAAAKAAEVARLAPGLAVRWHFVGRLQRNKCRSVAAYADVVHSVDRPELAAALGAGARRAGRTLDALVQVDLDPDPDPSPGAGRGGAAPADVPALAETVAATDGLRLAGIMAVAPLGAPPAGAFACLAGVARAVVAAHPGATVVSAGMSSDLEEAVAAGATWVRVGTALFGGRPPLVR